MSSCFHNDSIAFVALSLAGSR